MASSYPTSLDTFATNKQDDTDAKTGSDLGLSTTTGDHAAHHNDLADAINKIEAELGVNPSGLAATVAARFTGAAAVLNVKSDYGAKGDTKQVQDGAMTSASGVLTSATAAFTAADVGKPVSVRHATSSSFRLSTTIASVTNGTTVVLAEKATVAGTGKTLEIDGARTVADAVTTNDSTTLTSATAAFVAADVGKQVTITAAAAGALNTTIASYQSATQVTLTDAATRTCSAEQITYGTDDTTAFINAAVAARDLPDYATVYVPKGWYSLQPAYLGSGGMRLYSKTQLVGDGWSSILRMIGHSTNDHGSLVSVNHWSDGSADPAANQREIMVRDLHFQGHVVEDGFMQWRYLIEANAATDLVVEHCKFSNFQGDCIYLGSGTEFSTTERHNISIRIGNSVFDGINRDNRNAITIIDGEDVTIQRCVFRNCTRMNMPGAIDLEPNAGNVFSVVKAIHIDSCYFYFCGGNSGHMGAAFFTPQMRMTVPFSGYTITNNVVRKSVAGQMGMFLLAGQYPDETTVRNEVIVAHNLFETGAYCMEIDGMKGVDIHNNTFVDFGASCIFGYQQKSLDITLRDNTFVRCANYSDGVNEVIHCDRLELDRNVYDNCGDSDITGANLVKLVSNGGGLVPPPTVVATPFTTGGTLGAATRSYRLTSFTDNGETLATTAVTAVTTGTTARVDVTWAPDYTAAGTKVYGRTGGSELLMATLGTGVAAWSDTGAITPSGALPGSNTSAQGFSNGITFTNNTARQGPSNRLTRVAIQNSPHKTVAATLKYRENTTPTGVGNFMGPFVDSSIRYKPSARVASTATVTLPPGGTTLTIDGVALANGDRVLLKNQTSPATNGLYVVDGIATSVILTRSVDAATAHALSGMAIGVDEGTLNADTIWAQNTALPITLETTALRFSRVHPALPRRLDSWAVSGDTLAVLGQTIDRYAGTSVLTLPTAATHTCFGGIVLTAGRTITNVNFHYTTAASTITIFYVSLIRASDRAVLATSANATGAWTAAPLTKTVALSSAYTPDVDTPAYVGLAQAATVGAVVSASPVFPATTALQARAPILVGTTTTPTTTPITGTAGALTATVGGIAYCWLT